MSDESSIQTVEIKRAQCRHIFTDGHRCGSPCLNQEKFCYYHHATRRPAARLYRAPAGVRELPIPEDRDSLLLSIGHVIQAIASRTIDRKDAALLLYAFQVASSTLPREPRPGRRSRTASPAPAAPAPDGLEEPQIVHEAVLDKDFGIIALPPDHLEHEENAEDSSLAPRIADDAEQTAEAPANTAADDAAPGPTGAPAVQLPYEDLLAAAKSEAYYEATVEALSGIQETIAYHRSDAAAETEARLRAQFNLPLPARHRDSDTWEKPGNIPSFRAAADPAWTHESISAAPEPSTPVSRRINQCSDAPAIAPLSHAIGRTARKIGGHGNPHAQSRRSRPLCHRALRRLQRPREQGRDEIGPCCRRRRTGP